MIKTIFTTVLTIALIASSLSSLLSSNTHATTAGFQPGAIIDDGVMANAGSMNVSQIQAFLNSKVPNCDTYGTKQSEFGGGTRAQWAAARGVYPPFTCLRDYTEGGLSAAQIIYNVSQKYTINPQVLLVLLQKEQSLITDTWPLPSQYKTATGYGCPDTAPCNSKYYGLTNQIDWSANMYRSILNRSPNWYSPYFVGTNPKVYWHPDTSRCGSAALNIQNWSTASLYSYTPYRPNQAALNAGYGTGDSCSSYGNRNFYSYFTDWFGSTQFAQPAGAKIYSQKSTGRLYLVTGGTRYYIPNWDVMMNYKIDGYAAMLADDSTILSFYDGGVLTNTIWNSGGVFLVNNGKKYHMTGQTCTSWGVNCADNTQVKQLGADFDNNFLQQGPELGSLIYNNGIYSLLQNGKRLPFANASSLQSAGYSTSQALTVNNSNAQQPLGPLQISTKGVIRFANNPTTYYFNGTTYYKIPNTTVYNDWKFAEATQITPPTSSYDQAHPSSQPLPTWVVNNGKKYVIDQGRKLLVPANLNSLWPDEKFSNIAPTDWLDKLPTENLSQLIWSTPRLYFLDSSGKRYIPSYDDYVLLTKEHPLTTDILPDKLTTVAQGIDFVGDGHVVTLNDGTGRIFIVNNGKLTYIKSSETFDAYGLNWGAITTLPASAQTAYPVDGLILGNMRLNNGSFYINFKSSLYQLSPALAHDFGVKSEKFSQSSNHLSKKTPPTLSKFMYDSDTGRIYYASGGAIHYVSTYEAFVAYGGLKTPASTIGSNILSLFTVGQAI